MREHIIEFIAPHKKKLVLFLCVVGVNAMTLVATPLLYRFIINVGIARKDAALILGMALIAVLLSILGAFLNLVQVFIAATIGNRVVLEMRTRLFDHIQHMPMAFFTRGQTGALISRLNMDVMGAKNTFTDVLSTVVSNAIIVTLAISAMLFLSWQITMLALVLVPLIIIPPRFLAPKIKTLARRSLELDTKLTSVMVERFNVSGAQMVKLYGRPEEESASFRHEATLASNAATRFAVAGQVFFASVRLAPPLATGIAFGWGGVLVLRHNLDFGTLVAMISYLVQLYGPVGNLSNVQTTLSAARVSFERISELLDLKPSIQDDSNARALPCGTPCIAFENVSFQYPADFNTLGEAQKAPAANNPERMILIDVSFRIEPGQLVALVGPSGSGKSTIAQLIPRLYDVTSGAVKINNIDVRKATRASLAARIGMVTQDIFLFHDSIKNNLRYAKPNATDAELQAALEMAQLWNLVDNLPDGMNTMVGERGFHFSGGEKQRLSIARMLLRSPDIVILDEATAHLDLESEAALQRAFQTALSDRTSVVIAHRLSTILNADQILVVESGRIVEAGSHSSLLQQGGAYAELYRQKIGR